MLRLRSSSPSGCAGEPSSGTSSQMAPYNRRPEPPKNTSTTSATRTMIGSMSRWRARPPATPAMWRSSLVRRSRPSSRTSLREVRGPCCSFAGVGLGRRRWRCVRHGPNSTPRAPVRTIGDDPDSSRGDSAARLRVCSGLLLMVTRPAGLRRWTHDEQHYVPALHRGPARARSAAPPATPSHRSPVACPAGWPGTSACPSCGCAWPSCCSPSSTASA